MARPRDPDLRERLIAAATETFAKNGFAGASLDAIAARAGVTKGGVYFHFDGKEELFFAVLDHWQRLRRRELQLPVPAGGGAIAALRQFVRAYLRFHFREPAATHLLRVLATELRSRFTARLREDDRQEQRWLRSTLRELFVQGNTDGSLFADDPAEAAFVLTASIAGVLEQWHTSSSDVAAFCDDARLSAALVERWASGVRRDGLPLPSENEFDFRG
ncbi:MAG: TetR/AcrR family transcriptional regulator [Planctomycetota bacterium]